MIKTQTLKSGDLFIYNDNVEGKIFGIAEDLLQEARSVPDFGIISPLILNSKNKIVWHGGYISPNIIMPMSHGAEEDYIGQYPGTRTCLVVPFYCAVISKELIKKNGVPEFNQENIFTDANYCLHAISKGFKVVATDKIKVRYFGKDYIRSEYVKDINALEQDSKAFVQKWGDTIRSNFKLPVCYHTSVAAPTGFSVAVGGYMKALSSLGIDVEYSFLRGVPESEGCPSDFLLTDLTEKIPNVNNTQIIWGQAPLFFKNSGKYKIGHCEFEGEEWPKSWVPYCNMMDEVWVPTQWDREKAIKAGVNKPIYIIYQGIDPNYYHPDVLPMEFRVPQSFKFICTAAWDNRKNLDGLIKTFARTFKKTDDVCLIIKTMNTGLVDDIGEEIKKLNIPDDSGWVHIKEDDWPMTHLPTFYKGGHCFVLPTHGEGWGLPIFEALAVGIPVITTNYGPVKELLTDPNNPKKPLPGLHVLDYKLTKARTRYEYLQNQMWAEPDLNQLSEKMRFVYDNYNREKEKALETSKYIREKFSWEECCKPIISRLEEIQKKDSK